MHGLTKQLFILLCLSGFVLANIEPYSSTPRKSKSLNKPEIVSTYKRFQDNAPTLIKIFQLLSEIVLVFTWLIEGALSILFWTLNEVVRSCTEVSVSIFGALFNVVKLLEAVGFGVKFLLEVNFSLVSYLLETANCLKENFRHAVTLVKISLANETHHVYDSGAMVLEGVQNLLLTTCWGRILVVWEKIQSFVSIVIDNFDGFPKPNLTMITSTMLAATTFFFESIIITAGVIWDGSLFLFNYIGDTIGGLYIRLLANMFLVLTIASKTIMMAMQYILFLVTWPFYFLASIISNILHLLYSFWQVVIKWCCWLDETARGIIQLVFKSILQFTMTLVAETLNIINLWIPWGVHGLIVLVLVILLVYIWRKDIVSCLRLAWLYLRSINSGVQDGNAREVIEEEFIAENNENTQNLEADMLGETEEDQNQLMYELEREKDKRLCVICQDKFKNILLLPCRHVCLCQRCLQEIRHGQIRLVHCPLCREHVQSSMEVFV